MEFLSGISADHVVLAIIAAINAYGAWLALKARDASVANSLIMTDIKKATDGMKDALVAATQKSAKAEGVSEGREKERIVGEEKAAALVTTQSAVDVALANAKAAPVPVPAASTHFSK